MTLWWKRRKEARGQLAAAREGLEQAHVDAERTKRTVRPIREAQERNMFSEMIRDALAVGYDRREEGNGSSSVAR